MKNLKKPVVVIADDDLDLLSFLRRFLTKLGYEVVTYEKGEYLIKMLKDGGRADIILLDVNLSKDSKNGWEMCREIKKIRPEVKVVMLTVFSTDEDRLESLECGADMHIPKPVDTNLLLTVLERLE